MLASHQSYHTLKALDTQALPTSKVQLLNHALIKAYVWLKIKEIILFSEWLIWGNISPHHCYLSSRSWSKQLWFWLVCFWLIHKLVLHLASHSKRGISRSLIINQVACTVGTYLYQSMEDINMVDMPSPSSHWNLISTVPSPHLIFDASSLMECNVTSPLLESRWCYTWTPDWIPYLWFALTEHLRPPLPLSPSP